MELKLRTELKQNDTFAGKWLSTWEQRLLATGCCKEVKRWSWRGYALTLDKRRLFVDLRNSTWRVVNTKGEPLIYGRGIETLVTYLMSSSVMPGTFLDRMASRSKS